MQLRVTLPSKGGSGSGGSGGGSGAFLDAAALPDAFLGPAVSSFWRFLDDLAGMGAGTAGAGGTVAMIGAKLAFVCIIEGCC